MTEYLPETNINSKITHPNSGARFHYLRLQNYTVFPLNMAPPLEYFTSQKSYVGS